MSKGRHYERIGQIGQGKAVEIHLALHDKDLVVIKQTQADAPQHVLDRIRNEATVLRWIRHPNVVGFRDFDQIEGRSYLVMEYLDGQPLSDVFAAGQDQNRLDPFSTVRLIARAAEGLHALHELRDLTGKHRLNLVHHDVSLSNIIMLYDGQVKIIDLGLTRCAEKNGVKDHLIGGKIGYVAPEKLSGYPGDQRSDIFSLGCVMWQLITYRRLFREDDDDSKTIARTLTMPIQPPSEINPDVPPDLDALVLRMLKRDPDDRHGSMKQIIDEIESFLQSRSDEGQISKYAENVFGKFRTARRDLVAHAVAKRTASLWQRPVGEH